MLQRSIHHGEIAPGPLRRRARTALDSVEATPEGVRHLATEFRVTLEDAAHELSFSSTERVRKLVARQGDLEMYLCTWLPGQRSSIHRHADEPSAVRVIAGRLDEEVFERTADGHAAERVGSRMLETGAVSAHEGSVVHRFHNAGRDLAVTLHVTTVGRTRPRRLASAAAPGK